MQRKEHSQVPQHSTTASANMWTFKRNIEEIKFKKDFLNGAGELRGPGSRAKTAALRGPGSRANKKAATGQFRRTGRKTHQGN